MSHHKRIWLLIKLIRPLAFFVYWNRFYKGSDNLKMMIIGNMAIISVWTYNRYKYWWMPSINPVIRGAEQ